MHPSEQFLSVAKTYGKIELIQQWQHRVFHAVFVRDSQGNVVPVVMEENQNLFMFASHDLDELEQHFSRDEKLEDGERVFISATLQQLALFCTSQGGLLNWAGQPLILDADMLHFFAYSTIQHTKAMGKTLIESQLLSFANDTKLADPLTYCDGQHWTLTALNPAHPHAGDYPDSWIVSGREDLFLMQQGDERSKVLHRKDLEPRLQALYDRWATRPPTLPEAATEAEVGADGAAVEAADQAATAVEAASPEETAAAESPRAAPAQTSDTTPQPLQRGPLWPWFVLFFVVLMVVVMMILSL